VPDEQTDQQSPDQPVPNASGLPETYPDAALEQVRAAVKGNGVKPEDVKALNMHGGMTQFQAGLKLAVEEKVLNKMVGGRKQGGIKVTSAQQAKEEHEKYRESFTGLDIESQIRNAIIARDDKGLGLKNEIIKLPFLNREYIWHEACRTCGSKGEIQCQRCYGKGSEVCPRCNGQGSETCAQCNGTQFIWNGNAKVQCLRCNGTGKNGCRLCSERRRIQCATCKGKGTTQCKNCGGQGWNSHIMMTETHAIANYDFDRANMDTKLARIIESAGKQLGTYATVTILPPPQENTSDTIDISYAAILLHADVEIEFGNKHTGFVYLLGPQGALVDSGFFLDALIKPGLHELREGAESRGDVGDAVRRAGKYRTIRQGLILAARNPKNKAMKLLLKHNALGLSENAARTIINDAALALKKITAGKKLFGMITGTLLAGALYAAYFAASLRPHLIAKISNAMFHPAADLAVYGIGVTFSIFVTQFMTAGTLRKALHGLVSDDQKKSLLPRIGQKAFILAALCLVIFLGAAEASIYAHGHPPDWYFFLRTKITG
jgi:hypothetical protein